MHQNAECITRMFLRESWGPLLDIMKLLLLMNAQAKYNYTGSEEFCNFTVALASLPGRVVDFTISKDVNEVLEYQLVRHKGLMRSVYSPFTELHATIC